MKVRLFMVLLLIASQVVASDDWLKQQIRNREREQVTLSEPSKRPSSFFASHGLVFFYASTCPHCHQFAPILKAWATNHQATVLALSFNNEALSEFPQFLPATADWVNAAFTGQSISYPALFVVNSNTHTLYPVSIGAMSALELDARLTVLIAKIQGYEKGRKYS